MAKYVRKSRQATKEQPTKPSSGNRKVAFENSFPSETLLQQAIAGLLTRMPDVTGVQILQGTQELGKDLVFYSKGAFQEPLLCACVVKNTKITGNVEKNAGARTVLFQAEQAFDSTYTDSFGKDLRVERVYVVTPYDIPPATITSIRGRLQQRAGQVVFMGGASLFDRFREHWPDYLADEADIIERHLTETKNIYESDSTLESLSSQFALGPVSNYSKTIYVSQGFYKIFQLYDLGNTFIPYIPSWTNIQKGLKRDEVNLVQVELNGLKSAFDFLCDWDFCPERKRSTLHESSEALMTALMNALEKVKAQKAEESRLDELRREEGSLKESSRALVKQRENKKHTKEYLRLGERRKDLQKAIHASLDRLANIEREKQAEFLLAAQLAKALKKRLNELLTLIRKNLFEIQNVIFSGRLDGIQALSDPSFLQNCSIENRVRSAPDDMFISKRSLRLSFPKGILNGWSGHLLIEGAPGYGKTSFCRWHAMQDVEDFASGSSNIFPVYVPLYQFSRKPIGSFESTFLSYLGKSALLGDVLTSSDRSNIRVRLYLDGLDEIASNERKREIVNLARSGIADNTKYQVILTARDYIYAEWLDWLPRITLGGFSDEDINELVNRWLGQDSDSNKRFWVQINGAPSLMHLMRTPLLATIIIMVFRQTGELPESRASLYESFIKLLSGGWDLVKGVLRESKFGERVKLQVLGTLARTMQEQRRREFRKQDVKNAVATTLSGEIVKEWEVLQEELIIDGLLTESGDTLQFSHHSFQEFLAAKDFTGSPEPTGANRALEQYLCGDDWWTQVLEFYIGLSTSPSEIIKWITNQIWDARATRVQVIDSQIQTLRTTLRESFPQYSIKAIKNLGYKTRA